MNGSWRGFKPENVVKRGFVTRQYIFLLFLKQNGSYNLLHLATHRLALAVDLPVSLDLAARATLLSLLFLETMTTPHLVIAVFQINPHDIRDIPIHHFQTYTEKKK